MKDLYRKIPPEVLARTPLMRPEWIQNFERMRFHPEAPKWNTECGDRINADDLLFINEFNDRLNRPRSAFGSYPPTEIIEWIKNTARRSQWFKEKIKGLDLKKDFYSINPMTRGDLQSSLEKLVPFDEPLGRLVVNPTSGTSGQPVPCPNHPRAVGCYDPMLKFILGRHGVNPAYDFNKTAAIQLCAQKRTITYCTVHAGLDGAGFAKINLYPHEWKNPESAEKYISDMEPVFYSGDPFAFSYALGIGISFRPQALVSTATTLTQGMRDQLTERFGCPVIDMYSLNETGPVAHSCPADPSRMHILPHDIFVEVLDENFNPAVEGAAGHIAVTGGRNPFMPMLRYLTGDTAALKYEPCACGSDSPALVNFSGREQVIFSTAGGMPVNSIDIARIIRAYPVAEYQFTQRKDLSCVLAVRSPYGLNANTRDRITESIRDLFGGSVSMDFVQPPPPNGAKMIPFIKE